MIGVLIRLTDILSLLLPRLLDWVWMWVGVCLFLTGCKCQDDTVLASVEEASGFVERDFAASQYKWIKAEVNDEFRVGDGIQSKEGGSAVLALGDGSYARLAEKSRIRFFVLKKGKRGRNIHVETGEVELSVGKDDFTLVTGTGISEIQAGSRVRIRRTETGMDFWVNIGKAIFFNKNDLPFEIASGHGISLEIGSAVIERLEDKSAGKNAETQKAESDSEKLSDITEPTRAASSGRGRPTPLDNSDRSLKITAETTVADFFAPGGESFTVHITAPPLVVALGFQNKCKMEGAVQVGGKWLGRGTGAASVLLNAGKHSYRIFCLDESGVPADEEAARGRIIVKKDSGNKRLPNAAPSSFVDTDGRHYRILYQTRLPAVTVRWPDAPPLQTYVLHIKSSAGSTRKISSAKPELRLSSGDLAEGMHHLKFEAVGRLSRASRNTEVEIRFDNAAPTAGLTSPKEGGFGPGQTVEVSGETAPGWAVSLPGKTIPLDAQHRFKEQTLFQGPYRSIAIRLSHPSRGVHYYIRRGSGL